MANPCLDFEKPIFELEKKLAEWEKFSAENNIDVSEEMDSLQKKIQELILQLQKESIDTSITQNP